jgi:hypothetical protein
MQKFRVLVERKLTTWERGYLEVEARNQFDALEQARQMNEPEMKEFASHVDDGLRYRIDRSAG